MTRRKDLVLRMLCTALFAIASGCNLFHHDKKKKACEDTPTAPCETTKPKSELGTGLVFVDASHAQTFYAAGAPFSGASLPSSVDLSADLPVPGNQGPQNSCVGWAVAYGLKSFQEKTERGWTFSPAHTFSPAYVYNQINNGRDAGSTFEAALDLVQTQGAASLADMPYNAGDFRAQPSAAVRSSAAPYRIERWGRVNPAATQEIKAHVNAGTPVLIGVAIDNGFQMLPASAVWSRYAGPVLGGHAMLVVGFDDGRGAFKVLNSWSQSWSSGGYGWIDYDFFPKAVREAYVALDMRGTTPPPNPTPTPTPTPTPSIGEIVAATRVQLSGVNFNYLLPPTGAPAILFGGTLNVPSGGVASSLQLVIHFYYNNGFGGKGLPVGSRIAQFSTPAGTAATGTQAIPFPRAGLNTTWSAPIPYDAFNVARGGPFAPIQSNLVAELVLYVDNFPVRTYGLSPFFVRL